MGRKRGAGGECCKMAAGCCGVKKQKLSSSPPSGVGPAAHCNGGERPCRGEPGPGAGGATGNGRVANGLGGLGGCAPPAALCSPGARRMVVCADMCCYCFDVLYCHLYGYQPPRSPRFTNDP